MIAQVPLCHMHQKWNNNHVIATKWQFYNYFRVNIIIAVHVSVCMFMHVQYEGSYVSMISESKMV